MKHLRSVATVSETPSPKTPFRTEVVDVTPAMAAKWLEKNHPHNRKIAWNEVEAMVNDMVVPGAWKLTHQAICFDGDGLLIDGQHRLHAIVKANVTVRMLVIWNEDGDFHDPVDRGRQRSIGTILGMGHRDVAAVNVLRMLEEGVYTNAKMTLNEAGEVYGRHRHHFESMEKLPHKNKLYGAVLGACVWSLPVSESKTLEYAFKVATGEMIAKGDPAFAFRLWKERNKRCGAWEMAMASLNCMRHYLTDTQLKNVSVGEMGYRAFVSKRRAMKIPNTPGTNMVIGVGWRPSKEERDDKEE